MQKTHLWKNLPGILGHCNDVIYTSPVMPFTKKLLIYFGGDCQDLSECMMKHTDCKKYIKWSLENTAEILSQQFKNNHVIVVRASRQKVTNYAVFNCFENFVKGDEYGIPKFHANSGGLKHLRELIISLIPKLQIVNESQISENCDVKEFEITLVGFSKGCTVLNQFLHEFYYYLSHAENNKEIIEFIEQFKSMWWLDGGHGGYKNTWITDKQILKNFAALGMNVYIHVTPYQIDDTNRPWIRVEESQFFRTLQSFNIPIEHKIHFQNEKRSLNNHFSLLNSIKSESE